MSVRVLVVILAGVGCKSECEVLGEWAEGREFTVSHSSQADWSGVATSSDVSCAWSADRVVCWTEVVRELVHDEPLAVTEMVLSPAGSWAVALVDEGDLIGFDPGRPEQGLTGTTGGPYKDLWAGSGYTCIVRDSDDGAECGETSTSVRVAPEGVSFIRAVGDDEGRFCGLGIDRAVTCWDDTGASIDGGFGAGRYAALDGGRGQICAMPVEPGPPVCFGSDTTEANPIEEGTCTVPSGEFEAIAVGDRAACALDAAGLASCWSGATALPVPPDAFATLSIGHEHACGLLTDGSLACFGARSDAMQLLP